MATALRARCVLAASQAGFTAVRRAPGSVFESTRAAEKEE
jgi:hypothetical protein